MALLGSGHASRKSKYFTNVKAGLQYLAQHVGPTGSYRDKEGRMYSHGIAAIALCEAYALTREKTLRQPAQRAINYIAYAQDPNDGGWRYKVHEAGDTSASGWQLAAFQAAHAAGLSVPTATVSKFSRFLNTVQTGDGSRYLYKSGSSNNKLGNIGFYCRIHLGWKKDHPSLIKGAKIIASKGPAKGPAKGSFYHNYYSTQLHYHLGGDDWKKWNNKLRPLLVNSQATTGHAAGSWYSGGGDSFANHGGRLYCTVMAALTLQTPYRYERLYQ